MAIEKVELTGKIEAAIVAQQGVIDDLNDANAVA